MHKKFTSTPPGQDAEVDARNEAGLSWLGGYLLKTFRYQKALQMFEDAADLYPEGKNVLYNQYRMAKCYEKLDNVAEAIVLLEDLMDMDANSIDERVPPHDPLKLRIDKLKEVHGLGEVQ